MNTCQSAAAFQTLRPQGFAWGMTPLVRHARTSQAAATVSVATGPAVGITTAIAVPIKMEGN